MDEPSQSKSGNSPYIWLSLNNYIKSAEIICNDLKRIFPADSRQLDENLKKLKQEIFSLKADFEGKLATLDYLEVIAMTDQFIYLTESFNIDVMEYLLKPEINWTDKDITQLTNLITEYDIKALIHTWEPDPPVLEAIKAAGAKLIVLKSMNPGLKKGNTLDPEGYLKLMRRNLDAIINGLM